jgi:hypothetical protein
MVCSLRAQPTNEYFLKVSLRYDGASNLTFYPEILPWYQGRMALYVMSPSIPTGRMLDSQKLPVGAMWFGEKTIVSPGETLTGEIPLHTWFPDFVDSIRKTDLTVFWSYSPPKSIPLMKRRESGVIEIPKLTPME